MAYSPKRGPWRGIEYRNRYDYAQFKKNPVDHPLWPRFAQIERWYQQYDSLFRVEVHEAMRPGGEYRHRLEQLFKLDKKGHWYVTPEGTYRFEFGDTSPNGPAAAFLEWLQLRDADDHPFDVGDSP